MDQVAYLRLVRGETRGPLASLARGGLSLAAAAYRLGAQARNRRYDRRPASVHTAPLPVISVGNLTLGGTGKTPMVEWIAAYLRAQGRRVAILSRGYGQAGGLNDEGLVLEQNLPDVPHLQGADRAALASIAHHELDMQIAVLDDGFQHRRLGRDLDVVLLDALEPFGLGRLFPRGLLREPVASLRRAHIVVLSRSNLIPADERAAIRHHAEAQAGPLAWVEADQEPRDLIAHNLEPQCVSLLANRPVCAFCGIGNPAGFRRTLEALGTRLLDFRVYPDHHPYSASDVRNLGDWARAAGSELLLTTQKDFVKLRTDHLAGVALRALRIGISFRHGQPLLESALRRAAGIAADPD